MKIALWGKGKTGSKVLELHNDIIGPFGRDLLPTKEELSQADIILLFIPGDALAAHLPLLLDAGKPIVSGATGYEFDDQFKSDLVSHNVTWVQGHNFSLFMNIIKPILNFLGQSAPQLGDVLFNMEEIHHTKKMDAPSGTALKWKEWLNQEVAIDSKREGDVVGIHELELKSSFESITIKHESHDRALFAAGALFACKSVIELKLNAGFYTFDEIVQRKLPQFK
jgi:4-hydroxy-tetrahydrodipicolinate reductase